MEENNSLTCSNHTLVSSVSPCDLKYANFGWREDKHIVVEHNTPLGLPKTEKELKQLKDKYAVDAKYEEID